MIYDPAPGMRVAVIDIGSNSTRALVAEVGPRAEGAKIEELARRARVTRLGRGLETSGSLATEAINEVSEAVGEYLEIARELGAEQIAAFATSAVRDADNGDAFKAEMRERFALDVRVLGGDEEARMTWIGARHSDDGHDREDAPTLVADIGGGSTELITGSGREPGFHVSLQLGVVRQSERHLLHDPPAGVELEALAGDVQRTLDAVLAGREGIAVERAIAVAGTPFSLAAIERADRGAADPTARVEGHVLELSRIQRLLSRLACLPLVERAEVPGLHADRAPMIVAGTVILINLMRSFGLAEVTVSQHDILHGAALSAAAEPAPAPANDS